MRILHTADLHIRLKNDKRYRKDLITVVRHILDVIDQVKPDYFIVAGDIFDTKTPTPGELSLANALLKRILDKNIKIIMVPGNHDIPAQADVHNTLHPLENLKLKNLYISSEVDIISVGDIDVLTIPYCYFDKEEIITHIGALHNDYQGNNLFMVGHCWVDQYWDVEPPQSEFILTKQFLNKLHKIKYGALGHIHKGGKVLPNIYYAGSPFRVTLGEEEPTKTMYLWEDGVITPITMPVFSLNKFYIQSMPENIESYTNSICRIIAKGITIEALQEVDKYRTLLEKNGNYVYISLELQNINFETVKNNKIDDVGVFIGDYIKRNNLMEEQAKIQSLCNKIINEDVNKDTSIANIPELLVNTDATPKS